MRCPSSIPAPLERPALSAMPAVFRAAGVAEMVPFYYRDKHKKTKRVFPIVPANRLRDGQKGEGGWSMEDDVGMGGESPLPGVDDEEVPDSPLPCASPNGETGAGAEVMEAHGKPQEEGLAGGGVGDGADQPAASDAPPDADVTALGKRRDGAAAASPAGGPDESQKRSRLGDVMPGPPGYEDMVLTAADGTKVRAPRKVAAPKVGRTRERERERKKEREKVREREKKREKEREKEREREKEERKRERERGEKERERRERKRERKREKEKERQRQGERERERERKREGEREYTHLPTNPSTHTHSDSHTLSHTRDIHL